MSATPKLTVSLTTYNGRKYIGETIESILGQTFTDFELLIIDDCSTDDTLDVVRGYPDPRIRIIHNERNLGISATRNIGINEARGAYLAAHDHDDISLPERFARQVAFLDDNPEFAFVATAIQFLTPKGLIRNPYVETQPAVLAWNLMTRCNLCHSSICYRLGVLREHKVYYDPDYDLADDWELYARLIRFGRLGRVPEALVHYRLHAENNMVVQNDAMSEKGKRHLAKAYRGLLGIEATLDEIDLVWRLTVRKWPATDREDLLAFGAFLRRLLDAYIGRFRLDGAEAEAVRKAAAASWWEVVSCAAKQNGPGLLGEFESIPGLCARRPESFERYKTAFLSLLGPRVRRTVRALVSP